MIRETGAYKRVSCLWREGWDICRQDRDHTWWLWMSLSCHAVAMRKGPPKLSLSMFCAFLVWCLGRMTDTSIAPHFFKIAMFAGIAPCGHRGCMPSRFSAFRKRYFNMPPISLAALSPWSCSTLSPEALGEANADEPLHAHRGAPLICVATLLPFVLQRSWKSTGVWGLILAIIFMKWKDVCWRLLFDIGGIGVLISYPSFCECQTVPSFVKWFCSFSSCSCQIHFFLVAVMFRVVDFFFF